MVALLTGSSSHALAQGAVLVTPTLVRVEIPIGRSISAPWRWYETSTADGHAEYAWSAVVEGDTSHSIGFMLFKRPGATPMQGDFDDLVRAGQANLAVVTGRRQRVVREVRLTVSGEDSTLVLELRDPAVIATVFARKPKNVTFQALSPYQPFTRHTAQVRYSDF
ncbi:MAG: hypothetical protein WD801_02190 [Gemmatimonadaceae bacterium]